MEFLEENVRIPFEQKELDGVLTVPADVSAGQCTAVVLTHGAGGDMRTKQLESLAHALARAGILCLRFTCRPPNLQYRIRAYSAVVEYLKTHERYAPNSLFLGGRSMGARTAVAVCKHVCDREKDAVQGVLCLSFPLHVPGKPQTYVERSHGLRALSQTSVLFVSGTADNMCQQVNTYETLAIGLGFKLESSTKCYACHEKPFCCSLGKGCKPWTHSMWQNRRISTGGSQFTDYCMGTTTQMKCIFINR
ncbi:testis-expressed protein 30 isoform X1 [Carassius auratus]|uniref:Testis-expressed protein 30 isoform X1 n=1 Tax=Carassius auratus TaxID=7957 RepID=A0A6P6Q2W4_CARAU|nr:testis-expressed protein 30 isoform X1 [Carassius auratus]